MAERTSPRNVISVRFSDDELIKVKETSDRRGVPLSTLIRQAALDGGGPAGNTAIRTGSSNAPPSGSLQATVTAEGTTSELYAAAAASGGTATYRA